ncbi:hypothetical protein RE6C_02045 [Rhodopirellula europaea 6C]|uniref:Uncharacterized protein n=1 Tax=Rhodopirellula europaea 6C TaxID=1263867 RepID=M2B644_9BACT|nr:hypothetical protein RE6C_02045 [Rhodopirellula europaea 6C]
MQHSALVAELGKTFVTEMAVSIAESAENTSELIKVADRHIKDSVRYSLWGRSACRCQFDGCNELVWKSNLTQEDVNLAEAAHIYSFNSGGARGNDGIDADKINSADNLLLACRRCHKTIDNNPMGTRYSIELLQSWKREHESRVELVTGIKPNKTSHVLLYGAAIGNVETSVDFQEAASALFPRRFPARREPLELGNINFAERDHEPNFWSVHRGHLEKRFRQRVAERIEDKDIGHLSVFAIAPQPLLILLGSLLVDLVDVDVYQRHREPSPSWSWPDASSTVDFVVRPPAKPDASRTPALLLSLSAPIDSQRITSVIGDDLDLWEVTVNQPHNDLIKSPADLSAFRATVRPLIDQLKMIYGQATPLHVFPVASVSCNVELGRVRMPKAHQPWIIYDHNNRLGGFVQALQIGETHV